MMLEKMESHQNWSVRGFNNLQKGTDHGDNLAREIATLLGQPRRQEAIEGLRYLGVSRNHIGGPGAMALSTVISSVPDRLSWVSKVEAFCNVSCSEWFDKFFISLLEGLPSLEVVDLGGMVGIGDNGDTYVALMNAGVQAFASGRRVLCLREIHLDFLGLTDASLNSLLGIVTTLQLNCIFLEGNRLSAETLDTVAAACRLKRARWCPERSISSSVIVPPLISVPLSFDYGVSLSVPDRIARAVLDEFFNRIPGGFCDGVRGQIVVAGFASVSKEDISVLSLALGTSFVSYEGCGFSYNELVVDSHAEILARRALVHAVKSGAIKIADSSAIYLYTSTAPCGYDKKSKGTTVLNKNLGIYQPPCLTAQRRSCLAKIAQWQNPSRGWGGKHFPKIFPLKGVVVGRKYKPWCAERGFLPSSQTGTLESRLSAEYGVVCSTAQGDSDTAWFWSPVTSGFIDGRVGRMLDGSLCELRREALYNINAS